MAFHETPPLHDPAAELAALHSHLTRGETRIEAARWAGGFPPESAIAPHVRVGTRWLHVFWVLALGAALLLTSVLLARALRRLDVVAHFIELYPGTLSPAVALPGALPAWARVCHLLNLFLMTFILRSGVQILSEHPRLYWSRHCTPGSEWLRFRPPVPDSPTWTAKQESVTLPKHLGLPGIRHSVGLARWWHLGVDVLWLGNGLVFYALLFTTDEWHRLVPRSWAIVPHAASMVLQYLSLDWPSETGAPYNALQQLAYFTTVFVAAPLAMITGLGMSPALSTRFKRVSRLLSIQVARSLHFMVFCYFVLFIVGHVFLVFATDFLLNLNHIDSGLDDHNPIGFWMFVAWFSVVVSAWWSASPFTLRHPTLVRRAGRALTVPIQRVFEHVDASPGTYSVRDISPFFWQNGRYPDSAEYKALAAGQFEQYRLCIGGKVAKPCSLSLHELRRLPHHEQITQHFCIQGWSGVAQWGGVSMSTILDLVEPARDVKWVIFYSFGEGADGGIYYDAHHIEHMRHSLSMLAYEMNGAPLSFTHGAPLRLRNELELGFKQVKWIRAIEFVASFEPIGGGGGGFNEDHEFYGYRASI